MIHESILLRHVPGVCWFQKSLTKEKDPPTRFEHTPENLRSRRRDYGHRHRIYLRRIREGLRDKKPWAVGLFEYWDRILFPNADRDHDYAAACDELEDDEELENIFSEAPSITIPEQRRSDNNDRSDRATSSPTPHSRPRRLSTRQPAPPHVTSSSPSRAPSQLPASPPASAAKRRPTGRFSHRRAAASGSSRR
ncbi:hypothetical protein DFH07DRAFT_782815 [Mycena maculata]|uniref:Uncharacterized protein n=1 Tax=Mycena maculata TaxID=230809 RepID=A0AAD7HSA3_9AGAR|nr:hypothetical protein DFH07DRAFT_782815 [Mycena maculata]